MASGANAAELDFDSVQRGNPRWRRAQDVINSCWSREPTTRCSRSTTSVPAACPPLPRARQRRRAGARFGLSAGLLEESGLAPKEIWCNESQERYVLAIAPTSLELLESFERARALPACGHRCRRDDAQRSWPATRRRRADRHAHGGPARQPPRIPATRPRDVDRRPSRAWGRRRARRGIPVMRHPSVASKRFLITIADRTFGGFSHRDRWRPVAVPVCRRSPSPWRTTWLCGASHGVGRAHAPRLRQRSRVGTDGGRRGVDQPDRRAASGPVGREAVVQLDGRRRRDRWDAALFDTVRGRARSCARRWGSGAVGKDSMSMRPPLDRRRLRPRPVR